MNKFEVMAARARAHAEEERAVLEMKALLITEIANMLILDYGFPKDAALDITRSVVEVMEQVATGKRS